MIRAIHVGVEKSGKVGEIADVGDGRLELRTRIDLLLILGFHVFSAPTEMPDAGSDGRGWRRRNFVEENPRFLRPHAVPLAREFSFLAIEFGCVEIDRGSGLNS